MSASYEGSKHLTSSNGGRLRVLRVDAAPNADRLLSSSWQVREADCPTQKARLSETPYRENGRSERIRTSDPLLPKQVRYQAALHSDI